MRALGFRFWGLRSMVWGLGFRVSGFGFGVYNRLEKGANLTPAKNVFNIYVRCENKNNRI